MLKNFKNFLYKCDFFYSTELLRYKTQPEYRTLFGGILSLLIIIGLIVTFYNKLIDTVNKVVITSVSSNLNAADPPAFTISTFPEDNFMFGVQIWHHDLNTGPRYFDVILTSVELDTGERRDSSLQYPLEPCTLDHWEGFPDVQKDYERLKMNYWLCLPRNMKYNIQGKYASVFSQTLEVAVKKCTNELDPSRACASESAIEAYFVEQESFFFTIYFINPLINPTSEEYLTHYLEDNNYIIFTKSLGAQGILFMEEYSITTDQSIFPYVISHENDGGLVSEFALKNPYEVTGDVYCSFAFFKSGITRQYQRNFRKLDDVLSYIGGLFGTIAIALFIVNAYNGHSFQITLGAYLFHSQDQKKQNTLKSFNFWNFILQGIYGFLNLFNCAPKWKTIKQYYNCREEMVKQLDVLYLLKRVFFLERIMNILFEEHQLKGLHLQQKMTLDQAKRIRKNFKLKRIIMKRTTSIKKQLKPDESGTNLAEQDTNFQLDSFPSNQIIKSPSQQQRNKSHQFKGMIGVNDLNVTFDKEMQEKKDRSQINEMISEDSESSESENEDDVNYEIKKLKIEADQGDRLSKKIWKRIDKRMINRLSDIIHKQRAFQIAQEGVSEQRSDQADVQRLKINGYQENKLRLNQVGQNIHNLESQFPRIKLKKDKFSKQRFPKDQIMYDASHTKALKPSQILLEDDFPNQFR